MVSSPTRRIARIAWVAAPLAVLAGLGARVAGQTPDASRLTLDAISTQAAAAAVQLRALIPATSDQSALAALEDDVLHYRQRVSDRWAETVQLFAGTPGRVPLEALASSWRSLHIEIASLQAVVDEHTHRRDDDLQTLDRLRQSWAWNLDHAHRTGAPESVIAQIEATLASIGAARDGVQQRSARLLVLQDALAQSIGACDEAAARIEEARRQAVARVFVQRDPPIWRIGTRTGHDLGRDSRSRCSPASATAPSNSSSASGPRRPAGCACAAISASRSRTPCARRGSRTSARWAQFALHPDDPTPSAGHNFPATFAELSVLCAHPGATLAAHHPRPHSPPETSAPLWNRIDAANLVAVSVSIAVAAGVPALFPRLPLPGAVLEIAIGVLMGPHVLGFIHSGVVLDALARFGQWMLFLMAGFEMDPAVLHGRPLRNALAGWTLTAAIALAAALLLSSLGVVRAPAFTAAAMSTTAIGTLMPGLRDAGALGPPYGPMVLAAGAIGEAGPVMALSLVTAGGRASHEALLMLAFVAGAIAVIRAAGRASSGRFSRIVGRTMGTSGQFPVRLALCVLFVSVVVSERLAIDLVLGAFVAGAVVRAALEEHHHRTFSARLDGIGSAFLIPVFFVTAGTRLDIAALFSGSEVLLMIPVYALLMLAARGLPALLLYRADLAPRHRIALALHCGTQLSLVVAISSIAVHRGFMPAAQGTALVGGGILTVLLFPALARPFLSEGKQERGD